MTISDAFPARFYLNLNKHDERRRRTLVQFLDTGLDSVERLAALDGRWVPSLAACRGYSSENRYAQALTHKMAIWRARQRRAAAVLVFEDDVELAKDLHERLAGITLPDDWGVFLLGCQHLERPEIAGPGLVRCARTWDMHAYAVNSRYYSRVMGILTGTRSRPLTMPDTCDTQLQKLMKEVPVYAAWPNLAWQSDEASYAANGWRNDNYMSGGRQAKFLAAVAGIDEEMEERYRGRPARTRKAEGQEWLNWYPVPAEAGGSGLGDRLRSIAAMMALAELEGKMLRMRWVTDEFCPGRVEKVLLNHAVEIVENEGEWQRLTRGESVVNDIALHHTIDEIWARQKAAFDGTYPETVETVRARWSRMLRRLSINESIVRRVDEQLRAWHPGRLMGVHIRRTDVMQDPAKPINKDNMARYDAALLERARNTALQKQADAFLIACDNPVSAAYWREQLEPLGLPVFHHWKSWQTDALRQTSLEDAMMDLCLLSRCDGIIGSVYSSFAVVAAEMGSIPYEIVQPPAENSGTETAIE